MQDRFPWFVQPSDEEFGRLWQEGTFVFDTNVLLDLYRRSRSYKEDFFDVLEALDGRVWLPNRVVEEFMRNRSSPVASQLQTLGDAKEKVEDWFDDLKELNQLRDDLEDVGNREGPIEREIDNLLDEREDLQKAAKAFRDQVLDSLDELREDLLPSNERARRSEDDTLRKLEEVFDGKVGNPYDEEKLEEIYKEGKGRYADKIPPGFGDGDKSRPSRKYADLVIWKQILDYASEREEDLVFVTRDTEKEDWWEEKSGFTVGPHPHLRKEFYEEAGSLFWMYKGPRFLDRAKAELQVEVKDTSIEEARRQEVDDGGARKFRPEYLSAIAQAMLQMQDINKLPAKQRQETLQKVGMSVEEMRELFRQVKGSQIPLAEIQKALNQVQMQGGTEKFFEGLHHAQDMARLAREMQKSPKFPSIPQPNSDSSEDDSESNRKSQDNSGSSND